LNDDFEIDVDDYKQPMAALLLPIQMHQPVLHWFAAIEQVFKPILIVWW
jgi:hypothetical protein